MSVHNEPIKVFVSYTHDSPAHSKRVLELSNALRERAGFDCDIDQYHANQDWPAWMERAIESSQFVLVVCTPTYLRRWQNDEKPGIGLGAQWESLLTRQHLYHSPGTNDKFVPIVFESDHIAYIPTPLTNVTRVDLSQSDGFDRLRSRLLNISPAQKPLVRTSLAPVSLAKGFFVTQHPSRATQKSQAEEESESDKFSASVQVHMERLHRRVDRLTQDQLRIIQQLRGQRRVRISGCSGSGKTLVAAEKALRLSNAGVSTLFLCHNPLLAEHIVGMTRGSGVHVEAFGNWVARLAGQPPAADLALWTNYEEPDPATLARAVDVLSRSSDQFEAVIVDEGQDFRDDWWTLVERALSDPQSGILYIFHDDHQALLPYRASYPIKAPVLDLSRNCRNAGRVFELMCCLNPQAPLPEEELRGLGEVNVLTYKRGSEREIVSRAVRFIVGRPVGQPFVVLLGGTVSFEQPPFSGSAVSIGGSKGWQEEVRNKFYCAIRTYNKTGVICAKGGWSVVRERLKGLSAEQYPTTKDIKLVQKIVRSFRVDPAVRHRIMDNPRFRNALRWMQKGETLKLSRPFRAPLWTAEIILHFEREDWHEQIPKPKTITFREHNRVESPEAMPVFYVGAFKGLEADVVLMFVQGSAPVPLHEVYVGISRARLLLVLLIDSETEAALPPALRAFKCSFP